MWRKLLILPGALTYLLVLYWLFTLAFPFLLDGIARIQTAVNDAQGTSGLIFVESPEVYTRQRLVNDRYTQDAWLRGKLKEIDEEDSLFVDAVEAQQTTVKAKVTASTDPTAAPPAPDAPATDTGALPALPDIGPVPFQAKFELQSSARDKIRQLILENALDDRHDLSGNTVFGLKFDTAVLPGSHATLSPTVIVRMAANPLERLNKKPATLSHHFGRIFNPDKEAQLDPKDVEDIALLDKLDTHFDAWRHDVEQRLNEHKSEESESCMKARVSSNASFRASLCYAGQISLEGEQALTDLFAQRTALDEALYFVLRLPRRDISFGNDYLRMVREDASAMCAQAELDGTAPTVRDLITSRAGTTNTFALPDPWGRLFEMRVQARPDTSPRTCGMALDLRLDGLELPLMFVSEPLGAEEEGIILGSGWRPIACQTRDCLQAGRTVWAQLRNPDAEALAVVEQALDTATLTTLSSSMDEIAVASGTEGRLCFVEFPGPRQWFYIGSEAPDGLNSRCFKGDGMYFRMGSYMFLRRMSEVESYTYAAFPRGDVSGVVRETGKQTELSGGISGLPALSAALGLSTSERSRRTEALPSMINFASGEGRRDNDADLSEANKVFDFGWSIVKEGVKKPMVASQLVLVSVPAYLDELELELWKGFLDIDRVPFNRAEYNGRNLEDRIAALMPSFEKRTVRLKIPPDYSALDGVVVSTNLISGPRIKGIRLQRCFAVQPGGGLTISIPGERLWRSTVVTLDGIKANSIEVMPDMRGILANFNLPELGGTGDPGRVTRLLQVWTSEGTSRASVVIAHGGSVDACTVSDPLPGAR
ncbi:MAG: hypothetical protein KDA50_02965 [Rhodobacteraceae bacterium]|nr:hypothetical protein [Paracoccaceae bacterium]